MIYIVGLAENGGCWMHNGRYFKNASQAKAVANAKGQTSTTKRFILEEYVAIQVTSWDETAKNVREVLEIPTQQAQDEAAINAYVTKHWRWVQGWSYIT